MTQCPFGSPLIECLFVQLDTIWGAYGKVFKQGLFKNLLHNVNLSVGTSFLLNSSKLRKTAVDARWLFFCLSLQVVVSWEKQNGFQVFVALSCIGRDFFAGRRSRRRSDSTPRDDSLPAANADFRRGWNKGTAKLSVSRSYKSSRSSRLSPHPLHDELGSLRIWQLVVIWNGL
jgi:hypothetical protein